MVAQKKFPWTKLIAPLIGAICGQVLVMVIDSESWVPRLLVPLFALIAWGADRLLSSMPEPSRPTESGWHQAGQPVESEWYQAGRPVEPGGYPQAQPGPTQSIRATWLEAGISLWDRFLVAMVGPSRRMDENTKNAFVGLSFLFVCIIAGVLYFVFNPNDLPTFSKWSSSAIIDTKEVVEVIGNADASNPPTSEEPSKLKPDRFERNEIVYPQNGHMYRYTNLLPVGIEAGVPYGYGDFDNLRKLAESESENFTWIKCSMRAVHDSDAWQACSYTTEEEVSPSGYWRLAYYPKINQTWLEVVNRGFDQDGKQKSWVTILKVARGKRPNLNVE